MSGSGILREEGILVHLQILVEENRRASIEFEGGFGHLAESSAKGRCVGANIVAEEFGEDIDDVLRSLFARLRLNAVDGFLRGADVVGQLRWKFRSIPCCCSLPRHTCVSFLTNGLTFDEEKSKALLSNSVILSASLLFVSAKQIFRERNPTERRRSKCSHVTTDKKKKRRRRRERDETNR